MQCAWTRAQWATRCETTNSVASVAAAAVGAIARRRRRATTGVTLRVYYPTLPTSLCVSWQSARTLYFPFVPYINFASFVRSLH
jgi:MYXO-CTERM domain-containing protein